MARKRSRSTTPAPPSFKPHLEVLEDRMLLSGVTLTNPGLHSGTEGQAVSFQVQATDSLAITYSASGLPSGVTINQSTGLVSGTPGYANVNSSISAYFSPIVTASDGTSSAAATFSMYIMDVNRLPSIYGQYTGEGVSVSLDVHGTDNFSTDTLSYSASNLPQGLSINSVTGIIGGVVSFRNTTTSMGASFTPTVTLNDGNGGIDKRSFGFSVSYNAPLSLVSQSGAEGNTVSLYAGIDPTGTDGLTYSAANLPPGLTLNPNTGLISGIIAYNNASASTPTVTFSPTVTLTDNNLGIDTRSFTYTISDIDRLPTPATQSYIEGQSISLDMHGSDNTGTNTFNYSASGLPQGLTIDPATGIIGSIVGYANATGTSPFVYLAPTVTLSDANSSDNRVLTLYIYDQDRLPTIATQADVTGQTIAPVDAHGTDNTGTNTLSYSISGLPAGLSINPSTGIISGTVGPSAAPLQGNSWYYPTITLHDSLTIDTRTLSWVISNPSFSWSMSSIPTPTINLMMWQNNAEGQTVSLAVQASESSTFALTYSALNLPPGLSISEPTCGAEITAGLPRAARQALSLPQGRLMAEGLQHRLPVRFDAGQ